MGVTPGPPEARLNTIRKRGLMPRMTIPEQRDYLLTTAREVEARARGEGDTLRVRQARNVIAAIEGAETDEAFALLPVQITDDLTDGKRIKLVTR